MNTNRSNRPAIATLALAALASAATAAITISGVYDEQAVQTNAVDFSMAYSGNTTWTTGIGQTLGAAQIRTVAEFKPLVEAAALEGRGGVIGFDGMNNADYNQVQGFDVAFAGGTKQMTVSNRPGTGGNYSISGPMSDRTAISGGQFLSTGGNPQFDLDFTGLTGFGPDEKITAVGVTILGRNGQGTGRNYRVIARYTNGVDSGSSSTFRALDMQVGNTTQDSFSGIIAPDGYWITSIRVNSDHGIYTGLDDLAFITSDVVNPNQAPLIVTDLPEALDSPFNSTVDLAVTLDPATSPPPTWQWAFDAAPEDGNFALVPAEEGGTSATLSFTSGPAREGTYRVTATNSEGSATSGDCEFRVLTAAPLITSDLSPFYEPVEGQTLALSVVVAPATYPPPAYQWFFDTVEIPAAQGGTNPTFTILASPATDGVYYVDVTNSAGAAFSAEARVEHLADSDGDGIPDISETGTGTYDSPADTGTDPNDPDTDGDGISDGDEVAANTNPAWYNDALEWRPDGEPGGNGTWDATTANWFDGAIPPGFATAWDSAKIGLFPHPAGSVSVAGTRQANRLVFRHTGGTYNLNAAAPGATLAFTGADPLVRIERETRFNLPVAGGFALEGGGNTLRLTTDNSSSLAGAIVRVASGQLRGQHGDIGVGNELGAATTTIIVEPGAQIRYFNVNEGARNYPQTLRLAGAGFGNPGALNNDSNAANNIQWTGPVILDANATIATQNAATWTFADIHDDGAGDKTLTLLQQNNITHITGSVNLGGLLKTGNGTLNLAASAAATPGTLTLDGGTVRLNAPEQLAAATQVVFTNAGATLDLNGNNQTVANLAGPGSVAGAATLAVTGSANAGAPGQQLNVTGNLSIAGAEWRVSANAAAANRFNVQGNLDLDGTAIHIHATELSEAAYVIATYGSLTGQDKVTVVNLPTSYTLDFTHNSGTAIALVSGAADTYETWAAANGIAGQPFGGDFDHDGLSNGLEYAIAGLNPAGPDGFPGTFENGVLTFTKRPDAVTNGDLTYVIETSATLAAGSWTPAVTHGPGNTSATISHTLPTGQGKIFARLAVSAVP